MNIYCEPDTEIKLIYTDESKTVREFNRTIFLEVYKIDHTGQSVKSFDLAKPECQYN